MSGIDATAKAAITPRFATASVAQTPSKTQTVTPERATEITSKAEQVTARAEAHFEKHRQVWTNRQYGKLLARDGERMAFRPNGMVDDRKAHLMRAADHLVRQRHSKRMTQIEKAANHMIDRPHTDKSTGFGRG